MEELTEVITAAEFHPHHCNTFVYSSSKGTIRLCDMRASALCDRHTKCEWQAAQGWWGGWATGPWQAGGEGGSLEDLDPVSRVRRSGSEELQALAWLGGQQHICSFSKDETSCSSP